jgi:hypothetical protein
MKNKVMAKCWDCEIDVVMDTPDFIDEAVLCYSCAMARCGY